MASLLTIAVSALVFGMVILVHELGHFLAARRCGIGVEEFSIGFGPALWSWEKNGTRYTLRLLPVGGYNLLAGTASAVDDSAEAAGAAPAAPAYDRNQQLFPLAVAGKTYPEATPWQRFFVIASGAMMNFVAGFVILLVLVGSVSVASSKQVYDFTDGATSQATGLQANDEILSVNGHYCFVAQDVIYELQRAKDHTARLTVLRDGAIVTLPAVSFATTTDEKGNTAMVVDFRVYGISRTPRSVVTQAGCYFAYYARTILRGFADMATGRVGINELSGPVGVVSAVSEAVSYGWRDVLTLAALLTINLGIFNLLPIPALDGFKLLFLAWEGVSGRPVPERVQAVINTIGLALLLGLMFLVTWQDIIRFF